MRVSLKWLKEYVDINISPEELAERLTLSGLAVEGMEIPGKELSGVYVGKIFNIEAHPNADKLIICQISTGGEENYQIVTGATNVKVGDVVPVALENAKLSGGLVIKRAKLRGVESRGMLCSGAELGMDVSILPTEQAQGIMILDSKLPLGMDIKEALDLDDVVLILELTPNRGDCLSMIGVAREVATLLDKRLSLPESITAQENGTIEGFRVDIKDEHLCKRYVAKHFTKVKVAQSPEWIQRRLRAAGVRPISNIVDVTNYVMLELGQPMHAFDFDTIRGDIVVRTANKGERLVSLDGNERTLSEEMLVIADSSGPVAVAGVMGGLVTEVTEKTTNILLESAWFNPISIRRTSKSLGLRSESSSRFEKGIDLTGCQRAADRAAELLLEIGAGELSPGNIDNYPGIQPEKTICLRPERMNQILGINISVNEASDILTRLEFKVEKKDSMLLVSAPGHRTDVSIEEDLIEEVARIYGYDKMPYTLPFGASTQGIRTRIQALELLVKDCLASLGLNEVVTYSFTNPNFLEKNLISKESPLARLVKVHNPLSEGHSVMRTTLMPSLLEILSKNFSHRVSDMGIFELGKVFIPVENEKLPEENHILAIAAMGNTISGWNYKGKSFDFYYLKGIMETLFQRFAISGYTLSRDLQGTIFHPGKSARILIKDKCLGTFGEIHPGIIENYDLPAGVVGMEIDLNLFAEISVNQIKYRALPKYPGISRDLALVVNNEVVVQDIIKSIRKNSGQFLREIKIFDVYRGK
ncbi:MAG: phenylalanine--tRNA ligase subunit beta, partial [Peptococcaceae bacterium]|nr:phenylalanine--tRNA ligase subunit beta [Peptococcaceae bacterium]